MIYATISDGDVDAYHQAPRNGGPGHWHIEVFDPDHAEDFPFHYHRYICHSLNDFVVMLHELKRRGVDVPDHALEMADSELAAKLPDLVTFWRLPGWNPMVFADEHADRSLGDWQSYVVFPVGTAFPEFQPSRRDL